MEIKIYGRDGCPYCVKAKNLAQNVQDWLTEPVEIDYHDTVAEGLGKAELPANLLPPCRRCLLTANTLAALQKWMRLCEMQ